MNKILITGGSGLIGSALAKKLQKKGYEIALIGRNKKKQVNSFYSYYYWDFENMEIESGAIKDVDFIVHLAGENISEKKWSPIQKKIIENSRVKTAELLFQACKNTNHWPKAFISSSAIGYYGTYTSEKLLTEEDGPGSDFLATIGKKWETAADLFMQQGIRTVKIRTGVVLSRDGAAYPKMARPAKLGLAAAFGSGKQYVPWIHIEDIVKIYIKAIEDEKMRGAYNGVAPQHITNKELTRSIAKTLHKPYWLPNIPEFSLKAAFGEMSDILLKGSKISAEKIIKSGYQFNFPEIEGALKELSDKI